MGKDSPITKRGVAYCRVSSKEQVEGTSLETQERLCREYADRNSIEIVAVFIDKGESAKTADRKQFLEAIKLCSQKKQVISHFIVYKLDRFARNQEDHVTIRALLTKYGTELCSVTEPISASPIGKALEGMLSVFAEFDNNVRAERTKNGMMERLRQGIWVWQAPIGYYRPAPGNNLVPDPKVAPYIRLAFKEYAKGIYSYESLASFLSERGMRTACGKPPSFHITEKILRNSIYRGIMHVWNQDFKGTYQPLVSEELFARCQGTRAEKSNGATGPRSLLNPVFPLRRLVVCSLCLQPLTGSASTGRKGIKYPYYHHPYHNCQKAISIPKDELEDRFIKHLRSIVLPLQHETSYKKAIQLTWERQLRSLNVSRSRTRLEIADLERQRQRIYQFHREGKYTDTEFMEQKSFVSREIDAKTRLLEESEVSDFDMQEAFDAGIQMLSGAAEVWQEMTHDLRLRFQKILFPRGNLPFDGERFGTTKLSCICELFQSSGRRISPSVPPQGSFWNQLVVELKVWKALIEDQC